MVSDEVGATCPRLTKFWPASVYLTLQNGFTRKKFFYIQNSCGLMRGQWTSIFDNFKSTCSYFDLYWLVVFFNMKKIYIANIENSESCEGISVIVYTHFQALKLVPVYTTYSTMILLTWYTMSTSYITWGMDKSGCYNQSHIYFAVI